MEDCNNDFADWRLAIKSRMSTYFSTRETSICCSIFSWEYEEIPIVLKRALFLFTLQTRGIIDSRQK